MKMSMRALAMAVGLVCEPVVAQGLSDPTRPPDAVVGPTAGTAPSGLQSIIRRQSAKSGAVINGVYVELGGKVGDATLERIGEDSVELRSASGRETMYLTPGVGKKIVPAESNVAKRPRGKLEKAKP